MKMGVIFEKEEDEYQLTGQIVVTKKGIKTYGDHRMAMAFAPMALLMKNFKISDPEVVSKSYPGFWEDLKTLGFTVTGK